ncbi:hypothetical protein BT63DRAFT_480649 [Microthyrium microscopicum]|uniref:Uncharacterized protein n=1 Tax=Microthyrium microscopicum TaxID=703497 RepID=A0A6A6U6D4_9PEZI|nr:hypothetical protein BT63DRAFT_480649 [Microthyrium microscopicum]
MLQCPSQTDIYSNDPSRQSPQPNSFTRGLSLFSTISQLLSLRTSYNSPIVLARAVPTIAALTNPNATPPIRIDVYTTASASEATEPGFFGGGITLRPMISQMLSLRTRFDSPLTLFRGFGIFASLAIIELTIAVLTMAFLPIPLAIVLQIILPLPLIQLYALWTHTVLTVPSSRWFWQCIQPFLPTWRATAPALAISLTCRTIFRVALVQSFGVNEHLARREDAPPRKWMLVCVILAALAGVPAHLVLIRIQACLLPLDETPAIPIDASIIMVGKGGESEALGMKEALTTFGARSWARLVLLYLQLFAVVVVGGAPILLLFFVFNILFVLFR